MSLNLLELVVEGKVCQEKTKCHVKPSDLPSLCNMVSAMFNVKILVRFADCKIYYYYYYYKIIIILYKIYRYFILWLLTEGIVC